MPATLHLGCLCLLEKHLEFVTWLGIQHLCRHLLVTVLDGILLLLVIRLEYLRVVEPGSMLMLL